jgi:hypothetical protein
MDALEKLLIEQYKMDPAAAARYAQIIHGGASNPDNLQTEAYSKAVGKPSDFTTKGNPAGKTPLAQDNQQAGDSILTRMGQMKRKVELFTQAHQAKLAGHKLDPELERFYNDMLGVHQRDVAKRGMQTIKNSDNVAAQLQGNRMAQGVAAPMAQYGAVQGAAQGGMPQPQPYMDAQLAGVGSAYDSATGAGAGGGPMSQADWAAMNGGR